ncbi:hypothetical protein PVAP13_8KG375601 [Panicum virgatum]|uniref:Uncharacterized protein n=1 Tax=Panicum virgatum TaxID=38727 RepID=A0A8T0PYK9_PANVG|nr:hypothetical protein PVAP13_8KG375601 [Panicum virgatum]
MADPVATVVEKIVKIGLKIKEAVNRVRHNEEDCREITRRVLRFSAILSAAADGDGGRQPGAGRCAGGPGGDPAACPRARHGLPGEDHHPPPRRGGDLSKQLRRVQDDILN